MTPLVLTLYATCCGVAYLAVSVLLGVTLAFLFVTLVSIVSDVLDARLRRAGRHPLGGARGSA